MVLGISLLIFLIEVIGGALSGSLALLSDAGHVLTDTIALTVAITLEYWIYKKPERKKMLRPMGAYINAALLFIIAGWVAFEAIQRMTTGIKIMTTTMLAIALFGAVGNYVQDWILKPTEEQHLTHRAMRLHILSDLWQSLAVIVAGVIIMITGQTIADPIASLIIACVMVIWGIRLVFLVRKEQN